MKKDKKDHTLPLKHYRTWGLPLLGLMAGLATVSVLVTLVVWYWVS